jgi:hypothetical protein
MLKKKIYFLIFLVFFSSNFLSVCPIQAADGVQIPSIDKMNSVLSGNIGESLIQGKTVKGTEVLIYINGTFTGFAGIDDKSSATVNNYHYGLNTQLAAGQYSVMAVARDLTSMVLSPISKIYQFTVEPLPTPPAPILISAKSGLVNNHLRFVGLTQSGTYVNIFVDNRLIGQTETLMSNSGTADFALSVPANLNNGVHTIYAQSVNKYKVSSRNSNLITVKSGSALPAPVLKTKIVGQAGKLTVQNIVGWAKNDLSIKIFVDQEFIGQFRVKNDISGTANFALKIKKALTPGGHVIYTTALDNNGKESRPSNKIYFVITETTKAGQVNSAKPVVKTELNQPEKAGIPGQPKLKINVKYNNQKNGSVEKGGKQPVTQPKKESADNKNNPSINNLPTGKSTSTETGIIDESKHAQSKLKLNLIIFILFLLAVIGWIFWVNRELIKERREENAKKEIKPEDSHDEKLNL